MTKNKNLLAIFVTAAVLAPCVSLAATPRTFTPDWSQTPSAQQVESVYPVRAIRMEVEGKAELRCKLTQTGALADCAVTSDGPDGYGFGQAALKLSEHFALRQTAAGGPAPGDTVVIGVPFRLH
jgi:protein TonB